VTDDVFTPLAAVCMTDDGDADGAADDGSTVVPNPEALGLQYNVQPNEIQTFKQKHTNVSSPCIRSAFWHMILTSDKCAMQLPCLK